MVLLNAYARVWCGEWVRLYITNTFVINWWIFFNIFLNIFFNIFSVECPWWYYTLKIVESYDQTKTRQYQQPVCKQLWLSVKLNVKLNIRLTIKLNIWLKLHQKVVESYDQSRSSTLQLNMLIQSTISNQNECHIKHTYWKSTFKQCWTYDQHHPSTSHFNKQNQHWINFTDQRHLSTALL